MKIFQLHEVLFIFGSALIIFGLTLVAIAISNTIQRTTQTTKPVIIWIDTSGSTDRNEAISAVLEGLTQLLATAKKEKITYLVSIRIYTHTVDDQEINLKIGPRSIIDPFDLTPRLRAMLSGVCGGTDTSLVYKHTPEDTSAIVVSDMAFVLNETDLDTAAKRTDIRYLRIGDEFDPMRHLALRELSDCADIRTSQRLFLDELKNGKLS